MANPFTTSDWWRGAAIYQIYQRSFQDSNGDGIGDLRGVLRRLPYLAALGVEAIRLSPFFKSPMKAFGDDIADYREVDPIFGTLADFDALVRAAHGHRLKVLIDQVLSHCSDQHPAFIESRSSRTNPRADWFVWADAKPDGAPPNNWQALFGGSAWSWDTRRQQYYLHHFLASQPDWNFQHPDVQAMALANLRFWLDRGVDGFRLDVIHFCFHDAPLRDNPSRTADAHEPARPSGSPHAWQRHLCDPSRPEALGFLQRLRRLLNDYPGTTAIGEIGSDDALARVAEYTGGGDKLHMAQGGDLLGPHCDARFVHSVIDRFEAAAPDGWACWSLSNHDVVRVATRWHPPRVEREAWLRVICALQLSLRGSPCLYQGDELGLTEAQLAFDDLQDPVGLAMWPGFRGRDGCRTPMVWDESPPHAGFSRAARTWLPQAAEHLPLAATRQIRDPGSLFNFYRQMLAWRRRQPALRSGTLELLPVDDAVLAFIRRGNDGPLLCAFNLSAAEARYALPIGLHIVALDGSHPMPRPTRLETAPAGTATLVLPPCTAAFAPLRTPA